jgi:S-DNA-T family DNA segregation ATPase FtsK/SpoIIIE
MNADKRPDLRLVPRNGDDAPDLPLPEERHDELEPRQEQELDSVVYEGEIISDKPERPSRLPSVVVDKVTVLREPEVRKRAAQTAGRHGALVLAGWHSWIVRMYDGLTNGTIREQIRIAKATGDREALAFWLDKRREAKNDRYDRLMKLPQLALKMAILSGGCLLAVPVLLVIISTVVWLTGAGEWTDPWVWLGALLRWVFGALAFAWSVFVVALPFLLIWAGHRAGQRSAELTTWVVEEGGARDHGPRDRIPDESAIINALKHLGIAPLNKAFKAGWKPRIVLPTQRDGKGYRTQLEPPPGVTVEMINKKKDVLAHNLVRLPVEVWPTEPKNQPGVLDLWVADQGSLTGPLPDWPLLKDGVGDYFAGVPVSVNIRGKTIIGLLFQKNYALAGMMGSGKSTMIITLLLGAILDYLVEVDVFVFATNADYDPLKPRLRTLLTGPGDEVVEACLMRLRDVYAELSVRGQALKDHGIPAVTREAAEKDERLRPRIIVIDECQALFLNEELGEEAEELCVKLMGAARKYGVTLIFATPEPSSASLPRKLMAVISNKACFAIGDQTSNDAVLGTGSYKQGISAVGLEPKTEEGPGDIGTCMASGFQARPGLLRTYYVPYAEMSSVVERALMLREKAGFGPGGTVMPQKRDLLEDLSAVMGADPIKAADLPALLARHAPAWQPYKTLTGTQLVKDLAVLGVKVPSTANRWLVGPEDVRAALARRQSDDEDAS